MDRYALFVSAIAKDFLRNGIPLQRRQRDRSAVEDVCFVPSNILDVGSQLLDGIHPKWCVDRHNRMLDHISRIIFATMMSLDNGGIDILRDENVQRHESK
ncbi:hypothetical protein NW752_004175 [Fusarium irregulare]|uniref:Uncharacterized protein n=1 Tax=Fusarium irregulare TaxID=2494466 RepID=A0A9W8PM52_9HYPO|nr:hypothetical protein NW766_007074 [Fusarium irregulare]KAJ4021168.1 hypothetical protein NW752_004175 [Fusarium irregulare]